MSVLLKGMEMQTSCHACCFFGQADIWESDFDGYTKSFCKRTGSQTYDYVDKFLPNCPLVPVPPHGRLIDADVLKDSFDPSDFRNPDAEDNCFAAIHVVNSAPTIIPAEEGE
jgi:hypothetical protein